MSETIPFQSGDEANNVDRSDQVYTNEEVSEIIRIALKNAQEKGSDTVNREELLAIAKDFGLNENDINEAYKGIERSMEKDRQVDQLWMAFKLHVLTYACIMPFLAGLNFLTSPEVVWVQYPAFFWGFFVVVHGVLMRYSPKWALLSSIPSFELCW